MKYVMEGVEYRGFQNLKRTAPPGSLIVVAWFDGDPELWNVEDNPASLESLRHLYHSQWGQRDIPFTISVVIEA